MSGRVLPVVGSTAPWASGPVGAYACCVLAPNPSPWTLDGTNTWVVTGPDGGAAIVVDPGPADPAHATAIRAAAAAADARIVGIVLTHGHVDHSESARGLGESWGVPVRALDPEHRLGAEGLAAGQVLPLAGGGLRVVSSPGHSWDSVSLLVEHADAVLTGDAVLGRGTSVVAWPDGDLAEYLDSLARLADVVAANGVRTLLPGHGPVLADPARVLTEYVDHRRARLAQVARIVADGISEPRAVVEIAYSDVPRAVWPAAELTVRAQLAYLARTR